MTPHSTEAEQSVLGALLIDNNAIDRIGDLRVEYFYVGDHRAIFSEIVKLITAGNIADVITVFESLNGRITDSLSYLNSLAQNTPSSASISRYAEIVRDRALKRALIAEADSFVEAAKDRTKTAIEVLDYAQSAIGRIAETRVKNEPIRASDAMIAYADILNDRVEKKVNGISTGFSILDRQLNGGLRRGNLMILGARPSVGKTALALNIASFMADDYGVLFLSQEMSKDDLLDRAISFNGKIYLGNVINGEMSDDEWGRFTHASIKIKDKNLILDDDAALTLLDVRMKAMITKRKHGLDVLVLDYLQLMSGDLKEKRNSQLEFITRGLKALAKELNIAIISLSQLNRNAATRARPFLSDLRDSGAIEQDADIVCFLHREEVDNPDTDMRGLADLIVAKNRQGAIGDILLEYQGQYTLFSDTDKQRPIQKSKGDERRL